MKFSIGTAIAFVFSAYLTAIAQQSADVAAEAGPNESESGDLTLFVLPVAEAGALIGLRLTNWRQAEPYLTGVLRDGDIVLHPDGPLDLTGEGSVGPESFIAYMRSFFEPSVEGTIQWNVRSDDGAQHSVVLNLPETVSVTLDWNEIVGSIAAEHGAVRDPTLKDRMRSLLDDMEASRE